MIKIKADRLLGEKFHSIELDTDEFKKLVEDFIHDMYPDESVSDFEVDDDGVRIKLNNGEEIEIEIDWNEFVIK